MASGEAEALALVAALLPLCTEEGVEFGPCYMPAPSNGFVVYDANFKTCMHSFIIVPGFSLLPHWFLGALYILFTIYLFLGVAIASDIFMESVELITAATKTVTRKGPDGREVTTEEPVWNWVVANITLMAVGSSSPEIVLALMDCVLELGKPGGSQLGPSTIVGSGSFNLLVITAACTVSITSGSYKRVEQLRVFIFTMLFQFWAHIWMLIVYRWWTPNIISLAEALITLGMFPVLVIGAWLVDTRPWARNGNKVSAEDSDTEMGDKSGMSLERSRLAQINGMSSPKGPQGRESESGLKSLASAPSQSDGRRRIGRAVTGRFLAGRRMNRAAAMISSAAARGEDAGLLDDDDSSTANMLASMTHLAAAKQKVLFKSAAYSVLESMGVARVSVIRCDGNMDSVITVAYHTVEDSACAGLDFEPVEGILTFERGEDTKEITINIVDDDLSEPDVAFWVQLTQMDTGGDVTIIQDKVQVTIVDDDQNGQLSFELPHHEASTLEAVVTVVRRLGSDGTVSVCYKTVDGTALSGTDFLYTEGTLIFEPKALVQVVRVPIIQFSAAVGVHKTFKVLLEDPDGGAALGKRTQCRVTIVRRLDNGKGVIPELKLPISGKDFTAANGSGASEKKPFSLWESYKEQYAGAVAVPEPEEGEKSTWLDLTMHYCTITWKLMFALIPSPELGGGYPCFVTALFMLGLVVFLLVESTHMLGCIINLKPLVNGYSIVALGTSLPDTFAARIAAMHESSADAAIGSVMGSNSVNVFLGLGLPWLLGSLYSIAKGTQYSQPGGDLFFSVLVFVCVAAGGVCIMLYCRSLGGELGGPARVRIPSAVAYMLLWLLFLVLSGMRAYGTI